MSKTIIINESSMQSQKMKEVALASSLSKTIKKELDNNLTPLSNNPFFPEEYGDSFDKRLTLLRFKETKEELCKIGMIDDEDDVQNLLPNLIENCKRLEKPIRRNLEKIAYNFIIETFNVPEGVLNLIVNLTDDVNNTTLNVRVQAEDTDYEFEDLSHKRNLMNDINKRKIMNALMSGGALRFASNIKKYVAEIYELEPKLPLLYRNIIALNEYMLFAANTVEINDKNKNQLGLSNIILGNELVKTEVRVEAVIFPILIYEEIKAFLELSASHGLPKLKTDAQYVMGKCDYIQAEPWYMRIGPALWDIFIEMLGDVTDEMIPYIFMEISKLPNDLFKIAMHEIFSKTKKGKRILERIKDKHYNRREYQDFQNRMELANTSVSMVTDERIVENIMSNNLLLEISCKDAYERFYKDIPLSDYYKIIQFAQNENFDVLLPDTKWVLKLYQKKSPRLMEDIYKLNNGNGDGYLQIFNRLKALRKISGPESDINRFKSIAELGAFINQFDFDELWGDNTERKKRLMRDEFIDAKEQIVKQYEDDTWFVVSPLTYQASVYWGDGTEWCTAYKDSDEYYNSYASEGTLYININKKTNKKYQFHFESNSFMDKDDDEIETPILDTIDANQGLKQFYIRLSMDKNLPPEQYLRLCATKNKYGVPFDVYKINDKWYFFDIEDNVGEYLDYASYVSDWEVVDGYYTYEPRDWVALVKGHDGMFNYVNGYGELISRSWFSDMGSWDLTYGLIPVKRKNKWFIIDNYGLQYCEDIEFDNIKEIYDEMDVLEYYIGTANGIDYKIRRNGKCTPLNNDDEYEDYM